MRYFFSFVLVLVFFSVSLPLQAQVNRPATANTYINSFQSVVIDRDIVGDVYVVAPTVTIASHITGDLLVMSGKVIITGIVDGDIRLVAQNVEIQGTIRGNVSTMSQVVYVRDNAEVVGTISGLATKMNIIGPVDGNIEGRYTNLLIASDVSGNVTVSVTNRFNRGLVLLATARVGGDLQYHADREADVQEGARIAGKQKWSILHSYTGESLLAAWQEPDWWLTRFSLAVSIWLVGLLALRFNRRFTWSIVERMRLQPRSSVWFGLIIIVLGPLIVMLSALSLLALPLAAILSALYLIIIYSAAVWFALYLGLLTKSWLLKHQEISDATTLFIGVILYIVLASWPYVGAFILFLSFVLATGGWWLALQRQMKR